MSLQGQPTFLTLMGKALVIAVCAAIAASLAVMGVVYTFNDALPTSLEETLDLFALTLGASFMIGFPVAMLVYFMSWRHLVRFPVTLPLITFLAVVVMTIASFVIGDTGAVVFLGVPAAFAAATYAGLGYLWIIRPMRTATLEVQQ